MMHKGTQAIETQRLMLRRFRQEDARDMFERWGNDGEVSRYMRWEPMGTMEQAEKLMEHWVSRYDSEANYHWAVASKDDDRVMGSLSVLRTRRRPAWGDRLLFGPTILGTRIHDRSGARHGTLWVI